MALLLGRSIDMEVWHLVVFGSWAAGLAVGVGMLLAQVVDEDQEVAASEYFMLPFTGFLLGTGVGAFLAVAFAVVELILAAFGVGG